MEEFVQYAEQIGSHTFRSYTSQVVEGSEYTTQLFHLTSAGELKKMTYTGTLWLPETAELVEEKTLTIEDFDGKQDVMDTLLAELQEESVEAATAVGRYEEAPVAFPI